MADTGWHYPGTVAQVDHPFGTKSWLYLDECKTSNDVSANSRGAVSGGNSEWLWTTNYAMGVPDGATINGIYVGIEAKADDPYAVSDLDVRMIKAGAVVGDDLSKHIDWLTTDVWYYYGGSTNKWGTTWTVAQVNASNFGLAFQASMYIRAVAQVDCIRIKIYYTEAVGTNMKINIGDAWKDGDEIKINVGDVWKNAIEIWQNIGDVWKVIF